MNRGLQAMGGEIVKRYRVYERVLEDVSGRLVSSRCSRQVAQQLGQLGARVVEDLREAVVGLDVAELLVGRALALLAAAAASGRPAGPARGPRAPRAARSPCFASRASRSGSAPPAAAVAGGGLLGRAPRAPELADLRVGLLDLLEAPGGLGRAAVVVGMVQLHQSPVGGADLGVGGVGANAEHP